MSYQPDLAAVPSGCTPSLIGYSRTASGLLLHLSLTMAGGVAKTVLRDVQCPRFSCANHEEFWSNVLLHQDALPGVNHMRKMQYQKVLNLIFHAKIEPIQLHNLCVQLLHKTHKCVKSFCYMETLLMAARIRNGWMKCRVSSNLNSIHFFAQSSSLFLITCLYHLSLPFLMTVVIGSTPTSLLNCDVYICVFCKSMSTCTCCFF